MKIAARTLSGEGSRDTKMTPTAHKYNSDYLDQYINNIHKHLTHLSANNTIQLSKTPPAHHVMFQIIISSMSLQFLPISLTTVGSKPQCIMH